MLSPTWEKHQNSSGQNYMYSGGTCFWQYTRHMIVTNITNILHVEFPRANYEENCKCSAEHCGGIVAGRTI